MSSEIHPYIKMGGAYLLISPLIHAFFKLDFNPWVIDHALHITIITWVVLTGISILMFEYLEGNL